MIKKILNVKDKISLPSEDLYLRIKLQTDQTSTAPLIQRIFNKHSRTYDYPSRLLLSSTKATDHT